MWSLNYGLVVVVCTSISFFVVNGVGWSCAFFFVLFTEAFGEDSEKTSWITSTLLATQSLCGPLAGITIQKIGNRASMIIGSCIAAAGFVLCAIYATNVNIAILTYGVLGGLGFGFLLVSSIVTINTYFSAKRRNLASGISTLGTGVGVLIIPQILRLAKRAYNWQVAIFMVGISVLGLIVVGIILTHIPADRMQKMAAKAVPATQQRNGVFDNFGILKNPRFLLYLLNNLTFITGFLMFNTFIAHHTIQIGVVDSLAEASVFISANGGASILGRLVYTLLANRKNADTIEPYFISLIFCGLLVCTVPMLRTYNEIFGMCALYGFLNSSYAVLFPSVCIAIVGVEHIASAIGLQQLVQTVGNFGGGPFGGVLKNLTGNYHATFYVSGALYIICGVAMIYPWWYNRQLNNSNSSRYEANNAMVFSSDVINELEQAKHINTVSKTVDNNVNKEYNIKY